MILKRHYFADSDPRTEDPSGLFLPQRVIVTFDDAGTPVTVERDVDGTWAEIDIAGAGGSSEHYGTGIDGALTVSGSTTATRDMDYTTVVVQNGGTFDPDQSVIRATTSITVDTGGVIATDGGNSSGSTGGAAGGSSSRTLGKGTAGGNSTAGAGGNGATLSTKPKQLPTSGATSGKGASGGAGAGGAGGAGGTVTATSAVGSPLNPSDLLRGAYPQATTTQIGVGTGGGAGGGNGAASGTGGGGSGGQIVLAAPSIVNNGTIRAKGGNSANATNNNSGTGGGGGGGNVYLICSTFTGTAPDVSGGTGGTPLGTGVQGSTGSTGYTFTFTGV